MTLEYGKGLRGYHEASGQYPVYGTNGLIGWHSEPLCKHSGVIIGRKGVYRGVHYSKGPFFVIDTAFYLEPKADINLRWAYYELLTQDINGLDSGSAIPSTSRESFYALRVLVPPLSEQRAISEILGALDDKIELNRRMNETLEGIARAMFKSWFVDFDPVRAKAEGRQPFGTDAETAALFPDGYEDSPLGKIPKGWTARRVNDVADIIKGRSYASSELADSDTALVTLKSFRRGGGYRPDGLKPFIGQHKPDQVVLPGELVVAYTDVTQSADVIGKPAIVRNDARYSTLVASLDVGIIRPKSDDVSRAFLYCLFRTDDFQAHTYGHATGTTVLHLSKEAIPSFPFVRPTTAIGQAFASIAEPLFAKIDQNEQEASVLAELRDTLLPKLLSGEVRVADAERVAGEV